MKWTHQYKIPPKRRCVSFCSKSVNALFSKKKKKNIDKEFIILFFFLLYFYLTFLLSSFFLLCLWLEGFFLIFEQEVCVIT